MWRKHPRWTTTIVHLENRPRIGLKICGKVELTRYQNCESLSHQRSSSSSSWTANFNLNLSVPLLWLPTAQDYLTSRPAFLLASSFSLISDQHVYFLGELDTDGYTDCQCRVAEPQVSNRSTVFLSGIFDELAGRSARTNCQAGKGEYCALTAGTCWTHHIGSPYERGDVWVMFTILVEYSITIISG